MSDVDIVYDTLALFEDDVALFQHYVMFCILDNNKSRSSFRKKVVTFHFPSLSPYCLKVLENTDDVFKFMEAYKYAKDSGRDLKRS